MKLPFSLIAVAALPLACITGGYAEAEPAPVYGTATVTAAPVDIDTYPSVMYEGQPTYFYGDHWWYRDGGGHWA